MTTYVIGHKKPDLDSVVSAMAVAEFRRLRGDKGNPTAAIVEPINPETEFVFSKFKASLPKLISSSDLLPEDRVVLVDHNEADQRMDNLDQDKIIGIVDHHKLNLNLNFPIKITVQPVGSSTTIVYLKFVQYGFSIPTELAPLMLCAVLSDTVGLKSSTTTPKDLQAVTDLAKLSGISDIDGLTLEVFKAKSNINALTPTQIIKNDYKIFEFAQKTYIGQVETVEQNEVIASRKTELLQAMAQVKNEENVNLLFLVVTDILKVNSKIILLSDQETQVAVKAFGGTPNDNILDIGPKMSRKKDIAPLIEKALANG